MRIVMLGHKNAGKTTYIASMYALLRSGVSGFRIRAQNSSDDIDLLANAHRIRMGNYPDPSAHRQVHNFVLSYKKQDFFEFTWHDHRGGAFVDRTADEDTEATLRDLAAANGIVLFADAQELATDPSAVRRMRRLTTLLQRSIGESSGTKPVVIAYTKADLVPPRADWDGIRQALRPVFQAANTGKRTPIIEVAVACGRAPFNVQIPVLWCLGHGVTTMVDDLENEVQRNRMKEKHARDNTSIGDSLSSWWHGTESYAKQAIRYANEVRAELTELAPLRKPAGKLAQEMNRFDRKGFKVPRPAIIGRPARSA